jgi:vacuolar-type H+-ATPase subunit F/Vma7
MPVFLCNLKKKGPNMKRTEILVTGNNELSMKAIINQLDNKWIVTESFNAEDAIEKFYRQDFNIVVITNDINNEDERKLRKIFSIQNPDVIIIRHVDKEDHLLNDQINEALNKQQVNKKPSFSFTDDALKNAGLNITVQ